MKGYKTMKTYDLFFYTAKATDRRDPAHVKTWTTYKASMDGYTFDVILSDECLKKLNREITTDYPVTLTVSDDDYFTKKRHYVTKAGKEATKVVLVLMNFQAWKPAQFEKHTLEEVLKKIKEEKGE